MLTNNDGFFSSFFSIFFREMENVNVRMRGSQPRWLIEIRNQLRAGLNISHVLKVKVSNEPDNREHANAIRRDIKSRIWNVENQQIVQHNNGNLPITIMWTMSDAGTMSAYYYAVNLPYIDEIVGKHTRQVLSVVCNAIRGQHPEYGQAWGIAYLVTKPLALLQAMSQEDLPPPPVGGVDLMAITDANQGDDEEEDDY